MMTSLACGSDSCKFRELFCRFRNFMARQALHVGPLPCGRAAFIQELTGSPILRLKASLNVL